MAGLLAIWPGVGKEVFGGHVTEAGRGEEKPGSLLKVWAKWSGRVGLLRDNRPSKAGRGPPGNRCHSLSDRRWWLHKGHPVASVTWGHVQVTLPR